MGYDEVAEIVDPHGVVRRGRVLEVGEDVAVVEVFAGTTGLSIDDTRVRFQGTPMRIPVSAEMLGRTFGWAECPSVTQPLDKRHPPPKRLINFIRWASDLNTMHRCCTSATRDCSTCKDGAAHMSWVMVNKRAHIRTARDLQNWIEVYEMFAKLYQFIPW